MKKILLLSLGFATLSSIIACKASSKASTKTQLSTTGNTAVKNSGLNGQANKSKDAEYPESINLTWDSDDLPNAFFWVDGDIYFPCLVEKIDTEPKLSVGLVDNEISPDMITKGMKLLIKPIQGAKVERPSTIPLSIKNTVVYLLNDGKTYKSIQIH